jgi:peptidoglycan hydrolase-like protein with peptidoglycan-binding domain
MRRTHLLASAAVIGALAAAPALAQQTQQPTQPGQMQETQQQPAQTGQMQQGQTAQLNEQEIRQVQTELNNMGLYQGEIDGIAGPQTEQAVRQFQENNNLPATSTLDRQTADLILQGGTAATGGGTGTGMQGAPATGTGAGGTEGQGGGAGQTR